ncbi:hypothetical protein [Sphingomonas sp. 8AM]|uniref:hypothetical protein n=1 Tax=Sphingomonas sp. 8AM TaxID=2653170 RepID=UPI0012F3B7C0|nr:hypothetical protein [Sphingomonas sp. 8AM]VXC84202.1 hypothetical protein SPHINGO8AM_30190 [Sphingomonas sp. 8AM]
MNRDDYLKRRDWLRLAAACGLGAAPTIRRVRALATRWWPMLIVRGPMSKPCPPGGDTTLPILVTAVAARCRAIMASLNDMEGVK